MHLEMLTFDTIIQTLLIGIANGAVIALIAIGYTLVYGIIELINFAHGDLFMLGSFLALSLTGWLGATAGAAPGAAGAPVRVRLVACPLFCATLNVTVDRVVYKPLRNAPKLAPLVSAI